MNLNEIKQAIKEGKKVYWSSKAYEVRRYKDTDEYNIICTLNNHCIGLTWRDGKTLNGKEKDFFILDKIK
jgi:hypothetical protein